MPGRPTVFVVAGEPSGDQHAAMLGRALTAQADVHLAGVGQQGMRDAGFELLFDSNEWGGMGVLDSLRRLPKLSVRIRQTARWLVEHRPDLLVLVDFGAFNVRLARLVRKHATIRTLYYFPPKSWSRTAHGYGRLAAIIDRWATPFAWSAEILQSEGLDATWVGHPVVDRISPVGDRISSREELGFAADATVIGLLPGSRGFEISCNGPAQLGAAKLIAERMPGVQFAMSVAPSVRPQRLEALARRAGVAGVRLVAGTPSIACASDLVITSAGTATLEVAAAGCPMVVMYRGTGLMYLENLIRRYDRIMVGIPNIIAGKMIVPELLGARAAPENLATEALALLSDTSRYAEVRENLLDVRAQLGEPGVSDRVASMALDMMDRKQ